jgi:UDP-glucose 4-epimerase
MVIPNFVQQAISGQPITVYGNGQQSRAFGYVGDVVSALANLAHHPGAAGEVFNIGNTQEISINELADLVKKMTGSKSEIIHVPYDRAYEKGFEDMPRRVPDISKIQRLIGFQPSLDLEGILERVIVSIQNNERPELIPTQELAS